MCSLMSLQQQTNGKWFMMIFVLHIPSVCQWIDRCAQTRPSWWLLFKQRPNFPKRHRHRVQLSLFASSTIEARKLFLCSLPSHVLWSYYFYFILANVKSYYHISSMRTHFARRTCPIVFSRKKKYITVCLTFFPVHSDPRALICSQ